MNSTWKITGLAFALSAQLACAPMDSDQADDTVEATQSALNVNADASKNWLIRTFPAQRTITFCIANAGTGTGQFPTQAFRDIINNAYDTVGTGWSQAADVGFVHVAAQDASCNGSNTNVEYNVYYNPSVAQPGQAITTYPTDPLPHRVYIGAEGTPGQGTDYVGQAMHEFGHALGFLHENQVPPAVALTPADPFSLMNSDGATNTHGFTGLTYWDRVGVAKVYGNPVQSLGKPTTTILGRPAISTWGSGHFDVFVLGSDLKLWWKKTDNNGASWTAWSSLGGSLAAAPEAVSWGPNRIDVFARGSGNTLVHIYYNSGAWSAWETLVNDITASPAVASWGSGRLDVFYRSTAAQLHHRWFENGWGANDDNWGGNFQGSPSAVSWGLNRIDVVVRGAANDIQHFWWAGAPSAWESLGSSTDTDPGISSWGAGRLDFFARQSNQSLVHTFYDNNWNGNVFPPLWENLKGHLGGGPYPVSWRGVTGQIDLVTVGTGGDVQFNYRDPADGLYKSTPGLIHINCGDNGAFSPYVADTDFTGGAQKTRAVTISTSGMYAPAPLDVYKSQHYGSTFTYTIPGFTAGSGHVIRFHWAETNPVNNAINKRKFSVKINGVQVIWDQDLYKLIGLNHAFIKDIAQTANSSGKYVIDFSTTLDAASISGIEVF